jgi:L,D-peptidoglycan transpeptidase YkuD (ErfK/YbiS/YcfS/YnhG family)
VGTATAGTATAGTATAGTATAGTATAGTATAGTATAGTATAGTATAGTATAGTATAGTATAGTATAGTATAGTATAGTATAGTATTGLAASNRKVCPGNLADELSSTRRARQLITVEAPTEGTSSATVEIWQRSAVCWKKAGGPWPSLIGRNGFSDHHREGDGTTPIGTYGIGPTVYGNAPNPGTRYPYHRLVCGDWWDEDPTSARYNTFQHLPCGQKPPFGGSEALWTETAAYPSFAVVEYNTHPAVAYAGSAIFVHADIGVPTAGCVSVPLPDLDRLLRWLTPSQSPEVVMGPAHDLARL